MADDLNDNERLSYRAELGAVVQQCKKEALAQRVTLTQPGIVEFYNKNHGKDGRFSAGKSSGGGGGSLSDRRSKYEGNRGDREIMEFEIAVAKQNGEAGTKHFKDLQKTTKSIDPSIAKARNDLFGHVDHLKQDSGRKARKELAKEVKAADERIGKVKGVLDRYPPKPGDSVLDKVAHNQVKRSLKEEQEYHDHLIGKT